MVNTKPYKSRLALTPSGPLHFGSLLTALASYLISYTQHGQWILRIDDLDKPRIHPHFSQSIIDTLAQFGFVWHKLYYQSDHLADYTAALNKLRPWLFYCSCSRKTSHNCRCWQTTIVSTTFSATNISQPANFTVRLRTPDQPITLTDVLRGPYQQSLQEACPNFVLKRTDGILSYHLATVIDDVNLGITEVVRGLDLLHSTPRQKYIQQLLQLPTTNYVHLPLAIHPDGSKLSKQTHAQAINGNKAVHHLWQALHFLHQQPPQSLQKASLSQVWDWAKFHWQLVSVRGITEKIYPMPT